MKSTLSLYRLAEKRGIEILRADLPANGSVSVQLASGQCCIGVDENVLEGSSALRVHLAHELGHCENGSFYTRRAPQNARQWHENRADKWAIHRLIPRCELDAAIAAGHTDMWDLAEFFGVTEQFMRKAVSLYIHGNTAAELYF